MDKIVCKKCGKECSRIYIKSGKNSVKYYTDDNGLWWYSSTTCPACANEKRKAYYKREESGKVCIVCSILFHTSYSNKKTCSKDCQRKWNSKKLCIKAKLNKPKLTCNQCNKSYQRTSSRMDSNYCSSSCKANSKLKDKRCIKCSVEFITHIRTQKYCRDCKLSKPAIVRKCISCDNTFIVKGKNHNKIACKVTHNNAYKKAKVVRKRIDKCRGDRVPKWADKNKIYEVYNNCPDGYSVDHIIPLNGKIVSGLHVASNLQYITKEENNFKRNKFDGTKENNGWRLEYKKNIKQSN